MALSKQIGTDYGIYASYWKITDLFLDSMTGEARIIVSGFWDQAARIANAKPMRQYQFDVPGEIAAQYFPTGLDIAQVYAFVKTQSEFIFAQDC
jgi:hypothetical protein